MIAKQQLRQWAIALEQELEEYRSRSKDVAELCEYQLLIESIRKAKAEAIGEPVDLVGLSYYFFETKLRNFKKLTRALTCFSLLLEGHVLPPSTENGQSQDDTLSLSGTLGSQINARPEDLL